MKKIIALMLAMLMVVTLVACGSKEAVTLPEEIPEQVEDVPATMPEETEGAPEEEPLPDTSMDLPMITPDGEIAEDTQTPEVVDTETLTVLQNIWAAYADEDKFAVMGGNPESGIMDGPGNYDMAYAENLPYQILIPADKLPVVTEAATMIHMMNANTFTCGVVKLSDNVDDTAFVEAVRDSIQGNQWMCGFPEKLAIVKLDGCILIAFGLNDAMGPFEANMAAAYPELKYYFSEDIVG